MITFKELELMKVALEPEFQGIAAYLNDWDNFGLPYEVFGSPEEAALTAKGLASRGLMRDEGVTEAGLAEMEPYRVRNAVILAAGGSAKSSKSIYSLPKGLYVKDGEPVIERQIRQLKEAGIEDITIVVGYRQELYFYLGRKYDIDLVCSPSPSKGNVVSLNAVADRLSRTYVCCCDNFFACNPFSAYEYDAFHATVFKDDATRELKVRKNRSGRLLGLYASKGGGDCLYGHAFLDEAFCFRLREYMAEELTVFRVDALFWEELAMRHVEDLDMYARRYRGDFLFEFDTIAETQSVETLFINDVSDMIRGKICKALDCKASDISKIQVQDLGMTNVNLTFVVDGKKYMFRYPGESSTSLVSRRREVVAQNLATELGLDQSCVYIDEDGCKIARFREDLCDLSSAWCVDTELMKVVMRKMRILHDGSRGREWPVDMSFDPIAEGDRLMGLAGARKGDLNTCFGDLREQVAELNGYLERDGYEKVISHHDWKYDNVLIGPGYYDVIDWEYGMLDDPASDTMRVFGHYDSFHDPDIDVLLAEYLGHVPSEHERMHFVAGFAPCAYYWLGWLMFQESVGEECGFWTIWYYENALEAIEIGLPYYRALYAGR